MRGLGTDSVLGGRYRLTAPVAEGGMGEVWKALDELLDRIVAVKVLKPEFAADAGFLDRFRTEARNSARLSHPNIATLYDYGEDEGRAYLVMELVPGAPLSDLVASDAPLTVAVAAAITAQTARGLAAAHRAGLVHRDVKPGNLLVTPEGSVKITDFGISRATSQSPVTATGEVMGTAAYLAPEQALGRRDIGPATDLYALGVVLHEMLSGARPFGGDSQVAIALAQVNQPPPPLPASVSDAADALVAALLVKEPERRPSDAAGVAAVADRLAAGDDAGALTRLRGIVPAAAGLAGAAGAAGAAAATGGSTTVMPAGESTTRAMPTAVGGGIDPTAVVAARPAATGATAGTPLRGTGVGDREPAGGGGRPPRRLTTPLIGLIVVLAIILLAAIIGIFNGLGDADGPVTDPATDTTTSTDAPSDDPAPDDEETPPPPEPDETAPSSSTTEASPPPDDEEAPGGDTRPTQPAPATTTPKTPAPSTTTATTPPPAAPPADPDPPADPGDATGGAADGAADGAAGGAAGGAGTDG